MDKLKIIINKRTFILYLVLVFAVFNDILRISNSDFTLFRVLQPFVLVYMLVTSPKSRIITAFYIGVMFINTIQYYVFVTFNLSGIKSDIREFLSFIYFYLCITTVICLVVTIQEKSGSEFKNQFASFLRAVGKINIFIVLFHGLIRAYTSISVGNVNNYGASIAAFFPFFAVGALKKRNVWDIVFCILSAVALYVGDCKLSLVGIVLEVFILMLLLSNKRSKKKQGNIRIVYIGLVVLFVLAVFYAISGTRMGALIYGQLNTAIDHVRNLEYYSSSSSLGYRTNVIIMGIRCLVKKHYFGIGMGNFGKIIRDNVPFLANKWIEKGYVSPHNTPLQWLIEFGPIAVILYIWIARLIVVTFKRERTDFNIIFLVEFLSVWIWILNPSRIESIFALWTVFAFLITINKGEAKSII